MIQKTLKYGLIAVVIIGSLLFVLAQIIYADTEFGGTPLDQRSERYALSKHFEDGHFHNTVPEGSYDIWVNLKEMFGGQNREPPAQFPQEKPVYTETVSPGLRAVWFGHASVLVEIDGYRVFFDPMLSEHAFPVKLFAPARMNPPPLSTEELPPIEAVVVSHDHFDHLDMKTVQKLSAEGTSFFVGLGVGTHLEAWGVPQQQITEMEWGETAHLGKLAIHCTEARHYSGRKSMDKSTLWASWVVQGPSHSVYHSGDSGYADHFKAIGQRFPNIDMSFIKVGDYGKDEAWQDIHMVPEKSVEAHRDLGAKLMLPIHWGVFALSFHDWNEPIERTVTAAKNQNVRLAIPKIGEVLIHGEPVEPTYWWRDL